MVGWFELLIDLFLDVDGHLLVVLKLTIMLSLVCVSAGLDYDLLILFRHIAEAFLRDNDIEVLLLMHKDFVLARSCHSISASLKLIISNSKLY